MVEEKKVTMKSNTKQEIYDALQEALKRISTLKEDRPTAEVHKEEVLKAKIEDVSALVAAEPTNELKSMSGIIVGYFEKLLDKYEKKTIEYNDICIALEAKKKEFKDVYGIEVQADTLEGLLFVTETKKETLSAEIAELQNKKQQLQTDYYISVNELKNKLNEEESEYKLTLRKDRDREQEEYDYNLDREHQKDIDSWGDEKNKRFKEIIQRESDVSAREDAVTDTEVEFARLKEVETGMPKALENAESAGEKKGKAIAENTAKKDAELAALKAQSAYDLEVAKNTNLQSRLDEALAKLEEANGRISTAYDKIENIAKATVDNKNLTDVQETLKKALSDKSNQK